MVEDELARQLVERFGGHARDHVRDQHVQALGGQAPGAAHALEGGRVGVDFDLAGAGLRLQHVVGERHLSQLRPGLADPRDAARDADL